jgi:hypothetical protein
MNDATPKPMSEPFLSFAKAYIRYMHGFRPTKVISPRLTALRALEAALAENGGAPNPVRTDTLVLNRVAQMIGERYSVSKAYQTGCELETLATFLTENSLTVMPCALAELP